jgi:hypothetical protein
MLSEIILTSQSHDMVKVDLSPYENIHDKFRLIILFHIPNENTFIFCRKNVYNIVGTT